MTGGIQGNSTLNIGEALKRARTGQGIDVRTAEERTKIRIKYLRALESEQWDVLPNATYAKGFLRTYATMLGLDAERLVDEFRRQVESGSDGVPHYRFGEPVLERRVRPGEREERRSFAFVWVGLGIAAAVTAALIIGSSADEPAGRVNDHRGNHRHEARGGGGATPATAPATGPVTLSLLARQDIRVCLVRDGQAVIDAQALDLGSTSGPFQPADRYRLDLESGGRVELTVNGRHQIASAPRQASFVITAAGVRAIDFAGPRCP